LTLAAAVIAASGLANCVAYTSRGHDATMSGTLSAVPVARTMSISSRDRATIGEILSLGSTNTYIARLLADRDSTIERWPEHIAQPLRVWVDSSATLAGQQAEFPSAVRAAFAEWSATGIPLRFFYVSSPRDADIRVRWTDHLDRKTGSTTWRTDRHGWLLSGDIVLATHISDGHALDARGMRAIALHEVGHSLGLSHSDDPTDIMASLVRVDSLSAVDRGTIQLLYTLPVGRAP
ncbi:MAG: matrixin family metalloprotease, partial [Gemmatimonadaceae bacterium]